jgi:hypothetical protein
MNDGGAFHIALGQYKAWVLGWYHTHEALRQAGVIKGYRDRYKQCIRDLRFPVEGADFGVHHHWGYDLSRGNIANAAAGCSVGRLTGRTPQTSPGHLQFIAENKQDPRFKANAAYMFMAAYLDGKALVR